MAGVVSDAAGVAIGAAVDVTVADVGVVIVPPAADAEERRFHRED